MEVIILIRLCEIFPDFLQRVDLIAGVSGGSMITAALGTGTLKNRNAELIQICFHLISMLI